jgi:hypothetical protein
MADPFEEEKKMLVQYLKFFRNLINTQRQNRLRAIDALLQRK